MIGVQWRGWDGSLWDLQRGPAVLTNAGVAGLRMLAGDVFTRVSSTVDGQKVTGWRAKARDIFLPIDVSADSELAWAVLQEQLDRTFRPDREGTLIVTGPLGGVREVNARLEPDGGDALDNDPSADWGLETGYTLVADDPWYLGPEVVKVFENANTAPRDFYAGPGRMGPPFYLAPAVFTGADTLSNPGDVDVWPFWEIVGPVDSYRIDLGGRVIASDTPVPAGSILTIDTRPTEKIARLTDSNGTSSNATPTLELVQFARIPDGAEVPVNVTISGEGRARVRFRPRYFRAWG